MPKLIRVLVYEGDQYWIDETISRSIPEGKLIVGKDSEGNERSITALTFDINEEESNLHLTTILNNLNPFLIGLLKHHVNNLYKDFDKNV